MSEYKQVLANGDAAEGLDGWHIIEESGAGWQTEAGPGTSNPESIGNADFTTSSGWSKKSQSIDLLKAGWTAEALDQAPPIYACDWVSGLEDPPSRYYLLVELRDGSQKAIKTFRTPDLTTPNDPASETYPWRRIMREFRRYGPGLRHIYFEHGGEGLDQRGESDGAKMTGAWVVVSTKEDGHKNLLANPDGAAGVTGWQFDSSRQWMVEDCGRGCPSSAGKTNFVTSYTPTSRSQTIDLLAAGYSAAELDKAPDVNVEEWICSSGTSESEYFLNVSLLDEKKRVITKYSLGDVAPPRLTDDTVEYPWGRVAKTFTGYGTGLRYILFEDGGHSRYPFAPFAGPKMTGAFVGLAPGKTSARLPLADEVVQPGEGINDNRVRVTDTDQSPYWWVCYLRMFYADGSAYRGSGWLVSSRSGLTTVATAAHNLFDREVGMATSVEVWPALNGTDVTFAKATASGNQIQPALPYLVDSNGGAHGQPEGDFGAVVLPLQQAWPAGGFSPWVDLTKTIEAATVTVTGYPADKEGDLKNTMWTASGQPSEVSKFGIEYDTIYTAKGESGSPVAIAGTTNVVGIHAYGLKSDAPDPDALPESALGGGATRITEDAETDINEWQYPLQSSTRIHSVWLVVQTGDDYGARTNNKVKFTLLEDLGTIDSYWCKNRDSGAQLIGYDLRPVFPAYKTVQDLVGATYTIERAYGTLEGWGYWFWGDYQLNAVHLYVNRQRFHTNVCKTWMNEYNTVLKGVITESPWWDG